MVTSQDGGAFTAIALGKGTLSSGDPPTCTVSAPASDGMFGGAIETGRHILRVTRPHSPAAVSTGLLSISRPG